jgi:hypothetical protein
VAWAGECCVGIPPLAPTERCSDGVEDSQQLRQRDGIGQQTEERTLSRWVLRDAMAIRASGCSLSGSRVEDP